MRIVFLLMMAILLFSCAASKQKYERQKNKAANKIEYLIMKYPDLRKQDTIIFIDTLAEVVYADHNLKDTSTVAIDSFLRILENKIPIEPFNKLKENIRKVYVNKPCFIKPWIYEDSLIYIKLWEEGNLIKSEIKLKERKVTFRRIGEKIFINQDYDLNTFGRNINLKKVIILIGIGILFYVILKR